jgi:hypothetical protein
MNKSIYRGTSVYKTVCALCLDYDRRAKALEERSGGIATLLTYQHLNEAIDRGIASVCEEGIRVAMRGDIGNGIGVMRTDISCTGIGTYKTRKHKSIEAIAKELHLI